MDFVKALEAWEKIMDGFAAMGDDEVGYRSLLCMCIDYVAEKAGVKSIELMDELRPYIKEVNETMGAIAL